MSENEKSAPDATRVEVTPALLEEIREKAQASAQWGCERDSERWRLDADGERIVDEVGTVATADGPPDAAFIARMDPATALALVERIEALEMLCTDVMSYIRHERQCGWTTARPEHRAYDYPDLRTAEAALCTCHAGPLSVRHRRLTSTP